MVSEERHEMVMADTKFELCHDVDKVLEIGRAFQKQDLFRGAHHDTAKLLCDTIEYLRECLNKPVGNTEARREALEFVAHMNDSPYTTYDVLVAVQKARAALAEPPRNCDRYGGWMTALYAYNKTASVKWGDDVYDTGFLEWLWDFAKEGGTR